jgi:lipid-binding SYLF domain-containing protein
MVRTICILAAYFFAMMMFTGCATAPDTAEGKTHLENESALSLSKAHATDSSFAKVLAKASGCAVFPSVGKGAIGIGGAYGQGVLF